MQDNNIYIPKYELINQRQYDYYLQQETLAETERERVTAIISRFPAEGSLKGAAPENALYPNRILRRVRR